MRYDAKVAIGGIAALAFLIVVALLWMPASRRPSPLIPTASPSSQPAAARLPDCDSSGLADSLDKAIQLKNLCQFRPRLADLSKIAGQEAKLSGLKIMDLSRYNLRDIPFELGLFSQLEVLDLSGNDLPRLPANLNKLSTLKLLVLRRHSIPQSEIKQLRLDLPNLIVI